MKCLLFSGLVASTQLACEQCEPTIEQHLWCEASHGPGFVALGRLDTEGVCGPQDFQCARGEVVTVGLAEADAGACGPTEGDPFDGGLFCPHPGQP